MSKHFSGGSCHLPHPRHKAWFSTLRDLKAQGRKEHVVRRPQWSSVCGLAGVLMFHAACLFSKMCPGKAEAEGGFRKQRLNPASVGRAFAWSSSYTEGPPSPGHELSLQDSPKENPKAGRSRWEKDRHWALCTVSHFAGTICDRVGSGFRQAANFLRGDPLPSPKFVYCALLPTLGCEWLQRSAGMQLWGRTPITQF